MKSRNIIIIVFVAIVLSSCATKYVDMMAEGDVSVRLTPSEDSIFSKVDVYEHHDKTEINIVVRPKDKVRHFTVGTVNVLTKNPDGSEQLMKAERARIDKHRIGTKLQHAHFYFSIPYVLSSGTELIISIVPHAEK